VGSPDREDGERTGTGGTAADAWRKALEDWAIPPGILAGAPESPWGCSRALFEGRAVQALAAQADTPSRARAREALPHGGSVLDVGAGGGAASLPLAPPAKTLIAVDESEDMLAAFASAAERMGAAHVELLGHWPDDEAAAPPADVVVCSHVAYNVADLAGLFLALDRHATRRVVVELTAMHPQSDISPLWKQIHGIDRPTRPSYEDAVAVAEQAGLEVHLELFEEASLWQDSARESRIAFARRRLCVGPEYDGLIGRFLDRSAAAGDDRSLATIWWDARR
jgi:SAM-dependent methyltransferase